ncbi:CynX/NimT family MFS transporter [Oceanobacillus sp. 1P07AA]|uniref:CynX/NimT family MFS transporter n=1 Tax=Oceanobacillus sp. 1P07AA TaxID=3132293 RepID=UPI0039A645A2
MVESQGNQKNNNQFQFLLLVIGIIVVAFNLRPAITSVGPLISLIREDIDISNGTAGLLTSLPLIAFAIISPMVPNFAHKLTREKVLIFGLIFIIIGILIRSISLFLLLLIGTLIIGAGIAICNVLLPSLIKSYFPLKVALMTGIYTTVMNIFAAAGSGLSNPLAKDLGLGWQLSLFIWAAPAVFAAVIWIIIIRTDTTKEESIPPSKKGILSGNRMWRIPLAWIVAAFLGLQSTLFYVTISWLPEILHDFGMSMATAGWLLSITQIIGLPASFTVPILAGKLQKQSFIACLIGVFSLIGYGGLLLGDSWATIIFSLLFIGIALGGGFALALTFLGLRSKNAEQSTELSGMAQSVGYLLAAIGPFAIGSMYDVTASWSFPLLTLMIVAVLLIIIGYQVGKDRYVIE